MYPKSNLKLGDHRATCDICGFDFHASDLRKNWRNLYVCKKDFEPREELDFLRGIPDDPSVPWTRPDTVPAALEYNGDVSKTVIAGTNANIQNWNKALTYDRVVILSSVNAQKGDRFIIYKTVNDDKTLFIATTTLDSGQTV